MSKRSANPEVAWHSVMREAAMTGWGPTLRLCLLQWVRQRARTSGRPLVALLAAAVIGVLYTSGQVSIDAPTSLLGILRP